jgi:hypothetical protein
VLTTLPFFPSRLWVALELLIIQTLRLQYKIMVWTIERRAVLLRSSDPHISTGLNGLGEKVFLLLFLSSHEETERGAPNDSNACMAPSFILRCHAFGCWVLPPADRSLREECPPIEPHGCLHRRWASPADLRSASPIEAHAECGPHQDSAKWRGLEPVVQKARQEERLVGDDTNPPSELIRNRQEGNASLWSYHDSRLEGNAPPIWRPESN